jgi:hypothetical protein
VKLGALLLHRILHQNKRGPVYCGTQQLFNNGVRIMHLERSAEGGREMKAPELIWKCEEWRAGKMYERKLFDTKEDAEMFVRKLSQVAPDLIFKIAPVDVQQVWN